MGGSNRSVAPSVSQCGLGRPTGLVIPAQRIVDSKPAVKAVLWGVKIVRQTVQMMTLRNCKQNGDGEQVGQAGQAGLHNNHSSKSVVREHGTHLIPRNIARMASEGIEDPI
jgi:hypothetical protein